MKSFVGLLVILSLTATAFADGPNPPAAGENYLALPLAKNLKQTPEKKILDRYGVPFIEGTLPFKSNGSARVDVGGRVKRIFLLGMTDTVVSHSIIGDELGEIRLEYADGSAQIFPLIRGESLWWAKIFYEYPEPFFADARFRQALQSSLRLYPPGPVNGGNYVAVIVPKDSPITDIVVENSPSKVGFPVISGITVEPVNGEKLPGGIALPYESLTPDFAKFAAEKPLRPQGTDENGARVRMENLKRAFYTTDENFKGHVTAQMPQGYSGPMVSFKGDIYAKIMANVFYDNVQDMTAKVGDDGMYHTSTKGTSNWGIYNGFGSYRTNFALYYGDSWSRDMGRSLQELTELGYTNEALRCADYCLRTAKLWEEPSNKFHGQLLPPHWGRVANRPQYPCPPFENDGQGLVTLFLYRLWEHLPNRDEWLRARWPDIRDAGDWILWQFAHPEISGATNGLLHTTGESAAMNGYSVYPDCVCMDALRALAQMADSIGETNSSEQWRARADEMQAAIARHYIINDPKYGRVWTLHYAGLQRNTVLGPLIFLADDQGFAPQDDDPNWRPLNEAAYQRSIDSTRPFGFYPSGIGYGQAFATQSALLLDRMHDATVMLNWAAKQIYDPRLDSFHSFIVPEACDIDPTGRYWYRIGDLGNGVQEAEIIKTLRLVIGVDDTQPSRLQFYPRMPYDWNEIAVAKYPVLFERDGKMATAYLRYQLKRSGDRMKLEISSNRKLGPVAIRLGPFETRPTASSVRVNGRIPAQTSVEQSGDSWWVRFAMPVGTDSHPS
ncbi:MAG TPA: hypothetical protein VMF08_11285 [Candidatus Sulfotelmatobacter sp.]|nr:hypothetical protein [Candidatus Sulfotelmatobacter sp.]